MSTTTTLAGYVQDFERGSMHDRALLGGKGANLAEMTVMGLPVPPGFTITTDACRAYLGGGGDLPDGLDTQVAEALARLEARSGKSLGDPANPLLLSVRSGAPFSMPGMMDTLLNLGLNDSVVEGLAAATGDARFAWDAYRRLIQLYGKVVLGVPGELYEVLLEELATERGVPDETGLDADAMAELTAKFKHLTAERSGEEFPQDPQVQLREAILAVFRSWNGRRARDYRRMEGISDELGTAVNVQTMVFGNLGDDSGTGVAFTRDPATGEATPYGDWLPGAQGEDVVAGIRNTLPLADLQKAFPDCHRELAEVMRVLEGHFRDMCDLEFTIERGRLYILQTRVGKRTAIAAVRMAVEMVDEGLISERDAVERVKPEQIERLLHPQFDPEADYEVLTRGLAASPGAATGAVCFDSDEAERRANAGEAVILVRPETAPDDLHGMIAARGILTSRGGLVSHAAVVARGMGKPAVCGAESLDIDLRERRFSVGDAEVVEGDVISLDGATGDVVLGEVATVLPEATGDVDRLLTWADGYRRLGVRANADTPADVARARDLGAEGVGLCRTEHMFFGDRLPLVQRFILATDEAEEEAALAPLLEAQRADFRDILAAMGDRPVTIRLLDPPLHEFLPHAEGLLVEEARGALDDEGRKLLHALRLWQEANPMLGLRGCRLGILKPSLYRMQARAILEAAAAVMADGGRPHVEIMIPLVATPDELAWLSEQIRQEAEQVAAEVGHEVPYHIGTMIETPRAALLAERVAEHAEFFSVGSNDLTQMTFGFSRDDVEGRIMPRYLSENLLASDPFSTLDVEGVGELIEQAVKRGRAARPDLPIGVCGEHGGDPESIAFCHRAGLTYVSCSPLRVPVARLAAAHAALEVAGPGASA